MVRRSDREQVEAVIEFAARSLEAPVPRWMLILFDHGTPVRIRPEPGGEL